jgi:hypothetical protein
MSWKRKRRIETLNATGKFILYSFVMPHLRPQFIGVDSPRSDNSPTTMRTHDQIKCGIKDLKLTFPRRRR